MIAAKAPTLEMMFSSRHSDYTCQASSLNYENTTIDILIEDVVAIGRTSELHQRLMMDCVWSRQDSGPVP